MALEFIVKRSKKPVYPDKTFINLAVADKGNQSTVRSLVLFAVALVAILLFAKFGVVDVLGAVAESESRVAAAQADLTALEEANADFAELQERYAAYAVTSMTEEERALADRGAVLDLLQSTVANVADLQSVKVSDNTVLLQFSNTSLEDVSRVVASLESSDLVAGVTMSTARTDRNDDVVSTVTVLLNGASATAADTMSDVQDAMDEAQAPSDGTGV